MMIQQEDGLVKAICDVVGCSNGCVGKDYDDARDLAIKCEWQSNVSIFAYKKFENFICTGCQHKIKNNEVHSITSHMTAVVYKSEPEDGD